MTCFLINSWKTKTHGLNRDPKSLSVLESPATETYAVYECARGNQGAFIRTM